MGARNRYLTLAVVAFVAASSIASAGSAAEFDLDVLPILTKAGCNAAACHGAAAGRGGFKLSLFAENPAADYDAIVREAEGRRINLASSWDSLLLAKPSGTLDHEGGLRFDYDGAEAKKIVAWIEAGAASSPNRRLRTIRVSPPTVFVESVGQAAEFAIQAEFSDGSLRDVTGEAIFLPDDPAAIESDSSLPGRLIVRAPGRHTVVVRYLSQTTSIQLTSPLGERPLDLSASPRRNFIDDEVLATLQELRVAPADEVSPALLWRRLRLDLTGRLPTAEETRDCPESIDPKWLASGVDRLLASEEFVDYWTLKLSHILRARPESAGAGGMAAFHAWIKQSLREDRSWAEMAQAMIQGGEAAIPLDANGPANFYRVAGEPRAMAEYFSESLLGIRLRCANCHNHPLDRWTQDDYHGLAAIFAPVETVEMGETGDQLRVALHRRVSHPRTLDAAPPQLPGEGPLPFDRDLRPELAAWLTSPENRYFATAIVNRLWQAMLGRGLIEPVDDLRETNPATHPALLDKLTRKFIDSDFKLRAILREIALSATYARSSRPAAANGFRDDRYYSVGLVKPLPAEVHYDAIVDVTGVSEPFEKEGEIRAVALVGAATPSVGLDALGRCGRQETCDGPGAQERGLTSALHLLNGGFLNDKIHSLDGPWRLWLFFGARNEEIVEEMYFHALSRAPKIEEASFWSKQFATADDHERIGRFEDFLWGLMNGEEFTTNH